MLIPYFLTKTPYFFPSYSHEKKSYSHEVPKYFCNLLKTITKSSKFFPRKKKFFPRSSQLVRFLPSFTPDTFSDTPRYIFRYISQTYLNRISPLYRKTYKFLQIQSLALKQPLQSTKTFFQSIPLKKIKSFSLYP